MSIPTIQYKGFELRAYSQVVYPTYHNLYGGGTREFSSVVSIDTVPSSGACARRYATDFHGAYPALSDDAIERAMEYGKDIIDGEVQAHPL